VYNAANRPDSSTGRKAGLPETAFRSGLNIRNATIRRWQLGNSGQGLNWLKAYDKEVAESPEPTEEQRSSLFYFARYKRFGSCNLSEEVFRQTLSEVKICLSREKEIVAGLDGDQLDQLAALFYDTTRMVEVYYDPASGRSSRAGSIEKRHVYEQTGLRHRVPRYRKVAREAERREKQLISRLRNLRDAAQNLLNYAGYDGKPLSDKHPSYGNLTGTLDPLHGALPYAVIAAKCLEIIGKSFKDLDTVRTSTEWTRDLLHQYPNRISDPLSFCMIRLYWYLKECKLSSNEAEIRTGRIRNVFWHVYGVEPVEIRERSSNEESRGCNAVRIAVSRR